MAMESISGSAGRSQSSTETQERSPTRQTHQQHQTTGALPTEDAQDSRMGHPQKYQRTRHSGDASVAGYPSTGGDSAPGPSAADASQSEDVIRSVSEPGLSKTPPSSSTRPGSLATTAASSPGRPRYYLPSSSSRDSQSGSMPFLAVLARFAAFTVSRRCERFKLGSFFANHQFSQHRTSFFPALYVLQPLTTCWLSLTGPGHPLDSHHPRDSSTCSPSARYAEPKINWPLLC